MSLIKLRHEGNSIISTLVIVFSFASLFVIGGLLKTKLISNQKPQVLSIVTSLCESEGGSCCPDNMACSGYESPLNCPAGNFCCFGTCVIPSPTPTPACNGQCIPNGEECSQLGQGHCPDDKICCLVLPTSAPTFTPTPYQSPTPTINPNCNGQCIPNGETCYQPGQGNCQIGFICCLDYITPTPTRSPQPTPVECSGSCIPNGEADECDNIVEEPCPESRICCVDQEFLNCPWVNGVQQCTQTNPEWAWNPFPAPGEGCIDQYYFASCGQSVVSSILCTYAGPAYCNLDYVINTYYPKSTCGGLLLVDHEPVLAGFNQYFDYLDLSYPLSWEKINQNLEYGPVMIAGKFGSIDHVSLITGIDGEGRVYLDPFFNCENDNENFQICDTHIENSLEIILEGAISIRPK